MAERPILFSAPMVRALLADTKTQTRRAVRWRGLDSGLNLSFSGLRAIRNHAGLWALESDTRTSREIRCDVTPCPYGQPGDRLWVREAWARTTFFPGTEIVVYREGDNRTDYGGPWKPGIHMFRRDSRITLEVTGVRVERLTDIRESDASAEGVEPLLVPPDGGCAPYIEGFRALWESIHGNNSWHLNPWVWVVEFRRATSPDQPQGLLPEVGAV